MLFSSRLRSSEYCWRCLSPASTPPIRTATSFGSALPRRHRHWPSTTARSCVASRRRCYRTDLSSLRASDLVISFAVLPMPGSRASDQKKGGHDMLFDGGFTFRNFLVDVFAIFMFVLWFWLLITVMGDLFRRLDVSGVIKVLWVIFGILFAYLGVFIYLISQSGGMAARQHQRAEQTREQLRHWVGFSAADEIEKLERLKNAGTISSEEYTRLRARALQ